MDEQTVFPADFQRDLADRFNKGLAFDVTDGSADLGDDHIGIGLLADAVNKFFDLVRYMRDHLDGGTEIFSPPFLVQHIPVDLSGGEVGVFVQVFINKAFVMSEVQIRFRSVFRDINFPVLIGTHRPGVYIDIGIKFLCGNLQPPCFQEPSE